MLAEQRYYDAVKNSLELMERAAQALDDAEERGADEEELGSLTAAFDQAKATYDKRTETVARQEAIAEARSTLTIEPNEDPDERDTDPEAPANRVSTVPAEAKRGWDASTLHVGGEPATYQGGFDHMTREVSHSWFFDQLGAGKGNAEALERIMRSAREMEDVGRPMALKRDLQGPREVLSERAIAETAGAGGELVAPLYLQEEYLKLIRAGRPYVELMRKVPLPPNTNTINIPRLKTGTTTAAQSDLGQVSQTDVSTALLTFNVITVAGQESFARQLFDRSVPELADQVVFPDLIAAYITNTDTEALTGSGNLPHAKGVSEIGYSSSFGTVEKAHEVTFTSASPELGELYKKIADAVQRIHRTRFMPPTHIIMHPRRWAWIITQLDSQKRPLVVPMSQGPFNVFGNLEDIQPEGQVGYIQGLPVCVDPSIPTNLGSSTQQDPIFVQKMDDSWFMEDEPIKTRVYEEVLSEELAIRAQVFNYLALTHERYVKGIAKIVGTGLNEPAF